MKMQASVRIKSAINSPRHGRGQEIDRDQSAQASSLDPAPQLAAEAEGGAGTQDGQRARGLEGVGDVVNLSSSSNSPGVFDPDFGPVANQIAASWGGGGNNTAIVCVIKNSVIVVIGKKISFVSINVFVEGK